MPDGTQVTPEVAATAATEAEAPRPVMPFVTVLRSADAREVMGKSVLYPKRLTKTILRNHDGELYLRDYDQAYRYSLRHQPLFGIGSLLHVLERLTENEHV